MGVHATVPTEIDVIDKEELNDVNNEALMPFGSRLLSITAADDDGHPTGR